MKPKEAIRHCYEIAEKQCDSKCGKDHIQLAKWIEELQQYRKMESKLKEVYGECDGLLQIVVDGLINHQGIDIGSPIKARLLTDEDVDKWYAYKNIGTVEECREAVKKQNSKEYESNRTEWKTKLMSKFMKKL